MNELLLKLPDCPQRQDSFIEQISDLYYVAIRLGMYDAADVNALVINVIFGGQHD